MNDKTPRNKYLQPPTSSPDETVDRLEEKKLDESGKANRERIEEQEREVKAER